MKIDIKEVAEVLNRHGVECRYDSCKDGEMIVIQSEFLDLDEPDCQNSFATTLIRDAMVRDGLYMRHDIEPTYNGMRHCVGAARAITTHGSGWKETYTEALLTCMMEAWR